MKLRLNREILRLTLPAIISNITMPLMGLCDTGVSGHLGSEVYIGAIAVGTMMQNVVFWLFGFLRMGTTGLTAQHYGAGDYAGCRAVFTRAVLLGVVIGAAMTALQVPLRQLLLLLLGPEGDVAVNASRYFSITIWGAPAMLATMAIQGWLLGMQTTLLPMAVTITVNVLNIVLSLMFVFVLGLGFEGVAYGTLCASAFGFPMAWLMAVVKARGRGLTVSLRKVFDDDGLGRFFKVNSDIFFRSMFIMAVSMTVTSIGARLGSLTLAANAIIIQFYIFFSYCMDGFAFTGEALCGRFAGARDGVNLRRSVRLLLMWSGVMAAMFMCVYAFGYRTVISLLTDRGEVIAMIERYRMWILLIPLLSVLAFIYDGFFIGLTATRRMLVVTAIAATVFFAICFVHPGVGGLTFGLPDNNVMWGAFLTYLLVRGVLLAVQSRGVFSSALKTELPK